MQLGGDFLDLLILLADGATSATFVSVFRQLWTASEATGLSLQSLAAVVVVRCLHFVSYHFGIHYRPQGSLITANVFYYVDVVNCAAGILCVAYFMRYYSTYQKMKDNFGIQIFDRVIWLGDLLIRTGLDRYRQLVAASVLYSTTLVIALIWYSAKETQHTFARGFYMSFYEVMSALALVPQLWMFMQERRVPPLLANFVVFTALHKLLVLTFWVVLPWVTGGASPPNRRVQLVFEALNLVILSDFLYCWVKSRMYGYVEVVLDLEMSSVENSCVQEHAALG